ncbi:hypothetical protein HSB1_26510 [Halogranum salarium B-1]|uniref:Uncharacterized protein n=1 Tax=Halogranum salarium B-1 TaxID=1210908 RepID=J2ZEY0_9EURY|nr:hypothetical protein HSB1_26510 [Halogranum salarium B-1]
MFGVSGETKATASANTANAETSATRGEVSNALREIRREGYKIAFIYGIVDAALVTLCANMAFQLFTPTWVEGSIAIPAADVAVPQAMLVALGLGLLILVVETLLRARRPIVEQFEAANPEVREMLRTARDAVAADRNSRMAGVLYGDVLDRLRETSSIGLVDLRRLSGTLLVVVLLSVASIQVAVVNIDFGGPDAAGGPGDRDSSYDGLRDGNEVLGDAEDVSAGDNDIDAEISGSGEGNAPPGGAPSSYDSGGIPSADVESQQAGFSSGERLEDSELIRDYNLELRNETNV